MLVIFEDLVSKPCITVNSESEQQDLLLRLRALASFYSAWLLRQFKVPLYTHAQDPTSYNQFSSWRSGHSRIAINETFQIVWTKKSQQNGPCLPNLNQTSYIKHQQHTSYWFLQFHKPIITTLKISRTSCRGTEEMVPPSLIPQQTCRTIRIGSREKTYTVEVDRIITCSSYIKKISDLRTNLQSVEIKYLPKKN